MLNKLRMMILAVSALLMSMGVQAQITTSSMTGKVTDSMGEIVGATVVVVHEPSGTRYGAITNVDGRYTIQGMRTGGPYTVTISYVGYQSRTFKDITLQLGEMYNLNAEISESSELLSEVVITATASKFAQEKTGATTNISAKQMDVLPTVSRSITDITRYSPYANGMGFAGGDGRSTNFTIDGANFNNNFGLSSALPGGGNPISLDAIEEMQVVVSPFDVRQSNFIGGGINAVTKSGTNTFKGTAYVYYNNENMHGNRVAGQDLANRSKDRNTTYGFTLGGPIIKDKLHFFANFEKSIVPTVANRWLPSTDGVAQPSNYISRTTTTDLSRVSSEVKQKFGYDTGSFNSFPADESNIKILARLDWNINDNHHLAVRYNHTKNTAWNPTNGNSTQASYRIRIDRFSAYSMAFANAMYSQDNLVNTWSADLNSRFGDNISNQLLFTYSDIQDVRGSNSSEFPFVDILAGYNTGVDGTITQTLEPYMSLGYELFTYNNKVQNKVTTLTDNFTWFLGDHKLTGGLSFEHQLANNAYMRAGTGYYRYRSMEDFLNQATPETVALTYGYNGEKNPTAQVRFNQYGLYVQDEWNATDRLKLTGGIRFDDIVFNDADVMRNNAIYALDFGGRKIDTGAWPKNHINVSPRVGFTWDVLGDKSLKVRGGTGLFTGRLPLVFFTNMPAGSGMVQNVVSLSTTYNADGTIKTADPNLAQFNGNFITDKDALLKKLNEIDPVKYPTSIKPEDGVVPSESVGVDHHFKMPQVWKSSIAIDYQMPTSFPFSVTGEFTYTKNVNAVRLENYNMNTSNTSSWQRLQGADNRLIYPENYNYTSATKTAPVLTNTSKGYGWTANITLNAEPLPNLNLMAAYTHTVMKEVSGMPGSNASSAWSGLYTVNGPNLATVQNSGYVIPDRIVASVSYTYHKDHFSLFYTGYSPLGYSYIYQGDVNLDGNAYDLLYIPKSDSEINFTNDADRADFWKFVEQDSYLKNHKGEYAEAYSARAPFVHRFDFRWVHDFDVKIGKTSHKLQLSADIMNVGNLFHSSWGVTKTMADINDGQILKVDKVDRATGVASFSLWRDAEGNAPTKTWSFNHNYDECWKLQIGIKYLFN